MPTIRSWVQFPSPAPNHQVINNIFLNFSNALSLDFEPINMSATTLITNRSDGTVTQTISGTTTTPTSAPRIRAIQSGPFGIQFRAVEGGGIN